MTTRALSRPMFLLLALAIGPAAPVTSAQAQQAGGRRPEPILDRSRHARYIPVAQRGRPPGLDGSYERTAILWDLESGAPIHTTRGGTPTTSDQWR